MDMPKIVYHGTFWPEGREMGPEGLKKDSFYIRTTPFRDLAVSYAWLRRSAFPYYAGKLALYEIDTDKIPKRMRLTCIPPDGIDPRPGYAECESNKVLREARLKQQEWRFWHIPRKAIVGSTEYYDRAHPDISVNNDDAWAQIAAEAPEFK